jgi:hypothetical protein
MVVTCSSQSPLVLQRNQGRLVNSLQARAQTPFRANSFSISTQTSLCGNSFHRLQCAIVVTALKPCWQLATVFLQALCQPRCKSILSRSDVPHMRVLLTIATAKSLIPIGTLKTCRLFVLKLPLILALSVINVPSGDAFVHTELSAWRLAPRNLTADPPLR